MAATEKNDPDFDHLWDYDDPAQSEGRFRELLPAARASGNASYLVELLTQIARAEGLQHKFDDAHRTLDEAESLLPAATDRARVRYFLERGRVFNSSHRKDEARGYFLSAFELAQERAEDFYAVDAAHMMAIVEVSEQRLPWNLRAIELAKGSASPRAQAWLGSLYNNLGWTHHDLGRYQDALATFQESLEWQQRQGTRREARIANWTVARALRSLGRYEEALERQRENAQALQGTGEAGGYIEEELGECLLALGRGEEAREHFVRAHAILSQDRWLREGEPERLKRLEELASTGR